MLKKTTLLAVLTALGTLCAQMAQATETVRAEGRYVSTHLTHLTPFTAIEVNGDVKVDIRQLPGQEVTVSGRANLAALAHVRVEDNTLIIDYKRPIHVRGKDTLHVSIFMPQITALTVRKNGSLNAYGAINTTDIALTANDNGSIDIDSLTADNIRVHANEQAEIDIEHLNAKQIEAALFEKAEIDLSGYAQQAKLVNNGSKDLDASNLRTDHAHAAVNGHGDVEVFAMKTLTATANGRGEIKYHGSPVLTREGNLKKIKPVFED